MGGPRKERDEKMRLTQLEMKNELLKRTCWKGDYTTPSIARRGNCWDNTPWDTISDLSRKYLYCSMKIPLMRRLNRASRISFVSTTMKGCNSRQDILPANSRVCPLSSRGVFLLVSCQ
jgi:hypothetical protein